MCENGYANGNPNKPDYVVGEIRESLSPLYIYMSQQIMNGNLSLGNLNTDICRNDIDRDVKILYCRDSSKFPKN